MISYSEFVENRFPAIVKGYKAIIVSTAGGHISVSFPDGYRAVSFANLMRTGQFITEDLFDIRWMDYCDLLEPIKDLDDRCILTMRVNPNLLAILD